MPDAYEVLSSRSAMLMNINGVVGTGVGGNGVILVYCLTEQVANSIPRILDGVKVVPVVTSQPQTLY